MVSICIVNWNTRELLAACLRSLAAWPPAEPHEILVADNDSADGSAEMVAAEFPDVTLVRTGANLGFAAGNNVLLRQARGSGIRRRRALLVRSCSARYRQLPASRSADSGSASAAV